MRLNNLLPYLQPLLHAAPAPELLNTEISAIHTDSRQVTPGALYVALPGTRQDGHAFIPQALASGARVIVCSIDWWAQQALLSEEALWLPVSDTRQALAEAAACFYGRPAEMLSLLGVTGTNGKTTVTWLIKQLLTAADQPCGWIGTLGAGYGTVTLPGAFTTPFPPELQGWLQQMQQAGIKTVTLECSSHALEQQRLEPLRFDTAIFTNLTQDHLDYHLTMAAYAEAKSLLFSRHLPPQGTAIINADDPYGEQMARASQGKVLRYSLQEASADFYASDLELTAHGSRFTLHHAGQQYPVKLGLSGRYNVANALAALAAVLQQQVPLPTALNALAHVSGVPGRLERVSAPETPFAVYVDYAHTPDSLQNVLAALRPLTAGRLMVVFGCGGDRDAGKRPLMAEAAEAGADLVMITSDNPRSEDPLAIIDAIRSGLKAPEQALIEPDRARAIHQTLALASRDDTVLIAGKGHEDYQIIGQQRLPFDDRQVARHWLQTHC